MSFNITLPKITASNPNEQMRQMQSYIYQLAEQLNWALGTLESSSGGNVSPAIKMENGSDVSEKEAENTFNSIKALIIKSADIVKAYEETIMKDFNGTYFADSDFGTYLENTSSSIEANSKGVKEVYTNVQTIEGKVDGIVTETNKTNAYIKRGFLDDYDENGKAIYGVEVGETDENGKFLKYARFKADRLSFYDENAYEVAYVGAGCLYIKGKSVFLGELQLGGYKIDTSDGVAFTWIG